MAGLKGTAAIVGMAEYKPERHWSGPPLFTVEQWADLASQALDDAGVDATEVDGLVTTAIRESTMLAPATVAEYLGLAVDYAEFVDLGGASAAGMIWRAAAAIELGIADVVLCGIPCAPVPEDPRAALSDVAGDPSGALGMYGASSDLYGSPQAEFEIPYGIVAQNAPYAMIAQRYAHAYGWDERALAKIAVDQRTNACATPNAVFHGQPITIDDVLASGMIADPIHKLEAAMRVSGGACVVVASERVAKRARHRPVWVTGFGERLVTKSPAFSPDLLQTPIAPAAKHAFAMSGMRPDDVDMISVYDCYTMTVLMTIEDSGFCGPGEGLQFVRERDLTYAGDFPCNTHGGQLSYGQAGKAGGMSHVCDAVRQLTNRAGQAQVADCNTAFVTGNGGIMSEQVALVLQGG